jgi:NDP-sugar pyrophosphorylase family protein
VFHAHEEVAATMTVVRPYSQWGIAVINDSNRVEGFREQPRLDYWINGGFFCLEAAFLDHVRPDKARRVSPTRYGVGVTS